MRSNLKATRVLMIDAGLILAISITLVILNLLLLNRVNDQLTDIDVIRTSKLDLVNRMKAIIRERSIVMVDMVSEKDVWQFQDKYQHFHKLAVDFIDAREKFAHIRLNPSEEKSLQDALADIRITEPLQKEIVERIREAIMSDASVEGIHLEISKRDFPLEFSLLGKMENLYEQIIENANRQRQAVKSEYQRYIVFVGILSFAFILTIILLMTRSLNKIRQIETGLIKKAESLGWDATHDPLTNVYNRRWLEHRIGLLLERADNSGNEHSLLYLDLDGFKQINDRYGHLAGDNYLTQLCREIEHCIRQNDTFCRMGGDEFAILLENCKQDASIKIANQVLDRIDKFTLEFEGNQLHASCSIGVCQFSTGEVEFDALVHRVDELCYEAKRKGKNRIEFGHCTPAVN